MFTLTTKTSGQGFYDITQKVRELVAQKSIENALLTLFIQHTSASLIIQENADPSVQADLATFFRTLAPEGEHYAHNTEGPDDMPAHIKSALTNSSVCVPVHHGDLMLGVWQGIYIFEHRDAPQSRQVAGVLSPVM